MMVTLATTNWATISSLATAGGTLVLAIATFASVRSSSRSARIAEAALQEQRRPVLAPSRLDDPAQKTLFLENHWVRVEGGRAVVEHEDGTVYLVISVRNVGSGIAVCQGWAVRPGMVMTREVGTHVPLDDFRPQSRDLYVPAGDIGMWQGALRHPDDQLRAQVVDAINESQPFSVELLYSDQLGRQCTITRFALIPVKEATWIAITNRYWYLDRVGPRSDDIVIAAGDLVLSEGEAAAERRAVANREVIAAEGEVAADGAAAEGEVAADGAAADGEVGLTVTREAESRQSGLS